VTAVRRAITVLAVVALLAGPTALAFFQGGYFDLARLVAGVVAWVLFGVAALLSPGPLPRGRGGRIAFAGLVLLTAWSGASIAWTPLSTTATDSLQRLLLYVAALGAAIAILRDSRARMAVEPALALGTLAVVLYGLSDRLLPGVFSLSRSTGAIGRLEQPLTYWNAMGALAALGALLTTRVAADSARTRAMRAAAGAGSVPLIVGVWLSYSRGAVAALAVGFLALAALARTRSQLVAIGVTVVAGVPAAVVADGLDGVRALQGSMSSREHDGLIMLAVLAVLAALAAAASARAAGLRPRPIALPRWAPVAIAATVVAVGAAVVLIAARDRGHPAASGASAQRLQSVESNRYDYWSVALDHGFAPHPLKGIGAGGFAVIWLQYRHAPERAKVAHSLYIETLAELGIVGFAFLLAFLVGIAMAAAQAWRVAPARTAGPAAALVVWATHSAIDWDWEMPALTLVAIVLAGMLVATGEAA
jgi:O-Antigen ligase